MYKCALQLLTVNIRCLLATNTTSPSAHYLYTRQRKQMHMSLFLLCWKSIASSVTPQSESKPLPGTTQKVKLNLNREEERNKLDLMAAGFLVVLLWSLHCGQSAVFTAVFSFTFDGLCTQYHHLQISLH